MALSDATICNLKPEGKKRELLMPIPTASTSEFGSARAAGPAARGSGAEKKGA